MIDNVENWHTNLLKWLNFGPEDKKTAVTTLEAFYRGLGHFFRRDTVLTYNTTFLVSYAAILWFYLLGWDQHHRRGCCFLSRI